MRERVGPGERAHRDVLRRPWADARELLERGKRRFDMRRRLHAEPPSIDLARQRHNRAGPSRKNSELGDPRWLERGDLRRLREQAIERLVRRLDRSAEPFRESRGEHRRRLYRDLLP